MACYEMAPLGASDMEVGVLFADIRGFTSWCEGRAPKEVESALNRFYAVFTSVLAECDAIIDKMVGDEVMALFLPAFPSLREKACEVMVHSAEEILRRLAEDEAALPVGVGVNFGVAALGMSATSRSRTLRRSATLSTRLLGSKGARSPVRS